MNKWFGAAAVLSVLLTAAHIIGGTPDFLMPILQSDLDPLVRAGAAVVWHGVSALLIVNSAVLIAAAMNRPSGQGGAIWVATQYLGFTGLFLFYGITRMGTVTDLPQWVLIGVIAALIFAGLHSGRRGAGAPS